MSLSDDKKLLSKVLKICRGKTSLPLSEWKTLRQEIVDFLNGEKVDVRSIVEVKKVFVEGSRADIIKRQESEINKIKSKLEKTIAMNKILNDKITRIYAISKESPTGYIEKKGIRK